MDDLSGPTSNWHIGEPGRFVALALLLGLAVRLIHALLRALKLAHEDRTQSYWRHVWASFSGFHSDSASADYWYTYVIGCFELVGYSIFIAIGWWAPIGAWIGLKALAQWNLWQSDRARFNLFLVGNLLVIAAALLFLSPMVSSVSPGP